MGDEFGALQMELASQKGQGGISLSIANGLWVQTNFPFLPAYLDGVASNYDANLQQVNFMADAGQITGQINQWVANNTAGMITNLFASPLSDDDGAGAGERNLFQRWLGQSIPH